MDAKLLEHVNQPNNELIESFAMQPIKEKSLFIQNGVMYIIGGVSSGKSSLISKLIKIYHDLIDPIIICVYAGFAPDETTTLNVSSYKFVNPPLFVRLADDLAFINFFNQLRAKRLKISELLLFCQSIIKQPKLMSELVMSAYELFNGISKDNRSYTKRLKVLMNTLISAKLRLKNKTLYYSEYVMKEYSKKRNISWSVDPLLFLATCLISLSKGLNPFDILTIKDTERNKAKYEVVKIPPIIRLSKQEGKGFEMVPNVSVLDDVAQFHLLTTERASQWVKDLFAETRRWKNTFIVASQRYNLLNKSLRALTHTFFIGYSLIDDDLPKVAKEMPTNIIEGNEFVKMYKKLIKPFHFFIYNNKLGYNLIHT